MSKCIFEENTKSKAIKNALMSFVQDLMAIKVASNGYFMPIIYPNYLLMTISFEIIWFSLYVTVSLEGFNFANNIYTQNSFPCKRIRKKKRHYSKRS